MIILFFAGSVCGVVYGIKYAILSSNSYTQEEYDQAYDVGYDDAFSDKEQSDKIIADLKLQLSTSQGEVSTLTIQVQDLQNDNAEYQRQVETLTESRDSALSDKSKLEEENAENEAKIAELQEDNADLSAQIVILQANESENLGKIEALETKVANNEAYIDSLEATNQANLENLIEINGKILSLSNQILQMTNQIQENNTKVANLQAQITKLENSVAYYEQFIAQLENGEQVVATFEFNGSVWNIQIVAKGSNATPSTPTSTDYVIFNYWMVNNEQVDPSTYPLTTNTKFVANVTYKYDVTFMSDNLQYGEKQIVTEDAFATEPTAPTKDGYAFEGWTLDGVNVVEVEETAITENTVFIAKWSQLFTATFISEDDTISTQTLKAGQCPTDVEVESTDHKVFNGWKVNGEFVGDVETYPITQNTVFVADFTYKYDVTFMSDSAQYGETQIVAENTCAIEPTSPMKTSYKFEGWTLNGIDVVNVEEITITQNTIFIAKWKSLEFFKSEAAQSALLEGLSGRNVVSETITKIYYSEETNTIYVQTDEAGQYIADFILPDEYSLDNLNEDNIVDAISNSSCLFTIGSYWSSTILDDEQEETYVYVPRARPQSSGRTAGIKFNETMTQMSITYYDFTIISWSNSGLVRAVAFGEEGKFDLEVTGSVIANLIEIL